MKAISKTKVLFVIIPVLVLVGAFLLRRPVPEKSTEHENPLLSNQETNKAANNTSPVEGQHPEVGLVETVEEKQPLAAEPTKISKKPEELAPIINDDFEDLVLDEIGNQLKKQLGKHVFEMKPIEITNHPESVVIEFRPKLGSVQRYESFVKTCDANGNFLQDETGVTSSLGIITRKVAAVDEANNSFTLEEWAGGNVLTAGSQSLIDTRKVEANRKSVTYSKDGSILKAIVGGQDVTSLFKRPPLLVFPQKELHIGDTWTCPRDPNTAYKYPGDPNPAWKITAKISGFAHISGHDCVVVSIDKNVNLSGMTGNKEGANPPTSLKRRGKRYYDYEKMILVREEYMDVFEEESGPIKIGGFVVKNLIEE